ncbi:MAG: phytoene/squalene synthase family protein [Bryobacteraceae bacterium]|nr:phytoene/squalene synthase family protein [Bryobacteraceae bacterium]
MTTLADSYAHCVRIARARARNFYYSFLLLDQQRRRSICALYAFNRECDDLSDERGHDRAAARQALSGWREQLEAALHGDCGAHPIWPAFHDTVTRYAIPPRFFHEMIDGVTSDLDHSQPRTFDELYAYCYRVASAVGLSVLHIFGFESADALPQAEKCGIAFQLTNILRDVGEDARMGRVYLPAEDLDRFGVNAASFRDSTGAGQFRELMRFEAERARRYYRECAGLPALVHRESRPSLRALIGIYSRLLDRIEASDFDVLRRRIRVPAWEKCAILVRSLIS